MKELSIFKELKQTKQSQEKVNWEELLATTADGT